METTVAVMAVEGGYRGAGGVRWPYSPSELQILGVFFYFNFHMETKFGGERLEYLYLFCSMLIFAVGYRRRDVSN